MSVFSLSKIKSFEGRQGHGFSAEITRDGAAVASVLDEANGGMMRIDWFTGKGAARKYGNPEAAKELIELARAEYAAAGGDAAYEAELKSRNQWFEGAGLSKASDQDMLEQWINAEFLRIQLLKSLRRWSKNQTVFRVAGDKVGQFRMLSMPYSPAALAHLEQRFGTTLEFVFNPAKENSKGIG